MATKIYTKTGDGGQTGLIGGTRVPKSHQRIEAYGTVDELNSYIGLVADHFVLAGVSHQLKAVQDRLFTIGSSLACDPEKEPRMTIPDLLLQDIEDLEMQMDNMNAELPEMKRFILPGGHVAVSTTHVARCICRRAERLCVALAESNGFVEPLVLQYLNRLSDYLFVLARYAGHQLQVEEVKWQPRAAK